ncbi:MAG: hypothetical protein EHM20_09915 [Alphaproteobacteria bacterium]|nr:MAG: hypothetical protein EHM20_09915 [Alphaproteobacteria bacterium]
MKTLLSIVLILSAFNAFAVCPEIQDSTLNADQLIVKNLLKSAYKNKNEGLNSKNLVELTAVLKENFQSASEYLNEGEISSFIIEQDNDNNICANNQYVTSKEFITLISDRIIDTYYGCGCEH